MSYRFLSRMSSGVLALLLLSASLLTACGETTVETTADTSADSETTITETAETRPDHGLPDKDFGGAAYRMSVYGNDTEIPYLAPEESIGEAVNDAIYNRNSMLMDAYNFVFEAKSYGTDFGQHTKDISALVLAGEDAYELIYGHVVGTCNNAIIGDYRNLYNLPYLNFDAPWWPAQSVDEMTIFDCMYTITGSATYSQLASAKVVFFNKDLADQYNLDEPYELVRNGEWTIDALIGATAGIYQDVNGDGVQDSGDIYGYTTIPVQNGFFVSTNTPILSATADGGKEISVMTERTVALVEKLYSWYYESGNVLLTTTETTDPTYCAGIFAAGNAVFTFGKLSHASAYYRDSDVSYGILPQPKYDTNQENYSIFACPSLFSVPITCMNTELAGFVFEAMTYYGYYDVIPEYYGTTLQGKIADAPEDVEMLEIINDALTVSFAYCYDNWEGFAHFLSGNIMNFTVTGGNKDVASVYAKKEKSAQNRLDKCLEAFRNPKA